MLHGDVLQPPIPVSLLRSRHAAIGAPCAAGVGCHAASPVMAPPPPRLWRWPIALGLLTASGLLSALVSEGWGDWWSWVALGLPVVVTAWFAWHRPPGRSARPSHSASSAPESPP
ncbi:MAG TPA: hypothetical protein VGE70_12750 [Burkholderiaceae bacterium]